MKKRIISMLLVVVMVLAMFPTAFAADTEEPVYEAVGENLFLNGGFELVGADGKPQNTATGGMGDQQVWGTNWALETNPENVYEGNNSLLASTQSWTMIYPKHSVMYPGVTYQISYKIKGTFIAEGRDKEFGLNFLYNGGMNDVSCGGDVVYAKEDEWTTYTAVFTVPEDAGATGSIGLHLAWGQGTVYLDDFQCYVMEEVGDPTEPDPDPVPDGVNLFANGNIETLGEDGNPTDIGLGTSGGASGWGSNAWLETENVYEGSYALKLQNSVNLSYAQFDAQVEPYTNYIFSFKAKGTVDAGAKVGALVYAHGETTNYEKTYEGENIQVNEDTWTTLTYKVNSESYTTLQFLVGSFWAASTLYIDDVRLEVDTTPVDPDEPAEQIDMGDVYNNKVFYYPGATDGGAEVVFVAKYDVGANYTVDAALKDGDTVLWSQEDLEVVNHVAEFTYDTALMTEKEHAYTTEVTVRNANGQVVSVITEDCYIYDPPTVFNENGQYVEEDGSIFNPVFAFWGPDQWEELEDLAAAGVNCILWSIPSDETEALRQLDDLYAMGMKANVVMFWGMEPTGHPSNKDRVQEAMNWIKDHPAIYCWNVADEPYATANPPAGTTVRELMIESYKVIRAVDDKYPVTYVDADYTQYKHADDYVDFVMIDPYPGAQSFASWIGDKAAILAEYTDRPFAVIQQSFSFAGYEPYAHELHSMMYQAYLAGAQYQGYYGIGHGTPHLEAHPDLWPVIKGFYESGEWEVLFKQYSSGTNPTVVSNREGNVWYDVFQLDGDYFAILQNRTFQNQTVNIDLDFDVEALHVMTWSDDVPVTVSTTATGITATLTTAQAFMVKLTGDPYEFTPANPELPPQPEKPEIDTEGNLIVNGNFETVSESTGNPTNATPCRYNSAGGWGTSAFVVTDPEYVYEGTNSVKLVNPDGNEWTYIQVEAPQIEAGYNYTFSFKVKGTSGGNKIGSLIYAHGPSGSNYSFENAVTGEAVVPNMDEWTTLTYKFNSGTYTSMQFLIGGFWFANELYIDDIQLTKDEGQETPEEPDPEDPTAGLVAIGDNLASNGDVEYVTDGQANDIRPTDADWTNGIVEVSTDAYEGNYAIRLNSDGVGQDYVQFKGRNMEGGKWYEVRFMMKGDIKTDNGRDATFFIDTEAYNDNNGHSIGEFYKGLCTVAVDGSNVFTPTSEWTECVYRFQLKEGCVAVNLSVSIMGPSGYILVDNVSIREVGEKEPTYIYGENKASNSGIEYVTDGAANDINAKEGWTSGIVEVTTDAYEGEYALKLNSDGDGQDFFQIKGRNMEGGKVYQVDFMLKGDIQTANGRDATFFVDTECYTDNEGHAQSAYWGGLAPVVVPDSNVFTPTSDWTACSYQFTLKEGCCATALSFSIMGPTGYIIVDNVTIREVTEGEPEPEEPTITYGENKASNSGIEYVTDDGTRLTANDIRPTDADWTNGIVEVTTDAYEGDYALKLNSDGVGQDYFQIKGRNMEGGKVYQVDFMMKGDIQTNNGRDATFFIDTECYTDNEGHAQSAYWGGLAPVVVDGSNVFTPTSEWTACSYQFTLKEGCCATALSFSIMGPSGYIIVDNVTIREVTEGEPEPDVPDEPEVTGNLFANGGFETLGEDGNPTDVALGGLGETTPAWGTTAWLETDPANVYEGSNSVKMQAFGGLEFMELDSAVEPETDYVFSFKVKGALEEASNYVHPMIYAHGPSGDDWAFEGKCEGQSVIPSDEWQTVTYKFNSADYTSMEFLICANWFKGIYYVDDVQLVKASEYVPEEPTPDEPDEPVYTPDPANLIVNGSFEELEENGRPVSVSTKYGYPLNEGWGMEYSIVSGEGNVVSGNYAVKIVDEGKAIRMGMAPVEAKPNTTYVFSYKVKGTGGPMGVRLDASGAEFWPASSAWVTPNADEWTTMTYVYENVSATVLNFEITANWKAMDVIIDDVCLYEVGTENLFLNGGFENLAENGKPLNTATGGMGDQQVWGTNWAIETNPENVYEGSNSLLASTQSWTMIYPKHVDVEPGAMYMVSYKLKGTFIADGADKEFGLNFLYDGGMKDMSCGGEVIYAKADEWTTYTAVFTVPEDAAGIYGIGLHLAWGQGTVYLDDFQMYKVGVTEETEPDEPEVTYGNNVMKNGSFEELNSAGKPVNVSTDVDIPAWDGWETTHFLVTGDGFTTDGNYALKISESNGAWARAVMKADIEPNRSYLLTLDIKGTSAVPFGALIYAYGSANGTNWDLGIPAENQVMPKADEWTTLEYVFENTDYTSLDFLFGCTWNSLDVIIDNVQLREIGGTATEPEPEEPSDPDVLPEIPHESTNYVVNGSFEDLDDAGKPIGMGFNGWGESSSLVTDPEYVTDGNNAVKIELAENGWSYANLRANVEPNTQYVLYIDGRGTSNLKIGADIEFWRNDSGVVETAHIQHTDTGDFTKKVNPDSWTTMYWVFTTPAECHMMEIAVSIPWTTGTLYVDNIAVYRLANNFAENGSFESVEDGKAVGINVSSGWTGDSIVIETAEENVYEGSNSLKISSTDGGHTWAQVPARNLTPGATYQVSFWMKGELSRTDGKIPTFGYDLEQYTDNNGHNKAEFWGGLGKGASFPVTDEWQYCVEYFTLPDDIVAVNLTMGMIGATGTVYFDDVRIQKYEDAAMGELLNERVFYYPEDETGFAELTFPEAYAVAENYVLDIALTDGSLVLAEEKDVEIVDNYAIFNYDLSLLTKKEHAYTVIATLTDADGDVVSTMQEDIYIYDRPTALNENGEYVEEDGSIFNPVYAFWGPDQWDELDDLAAAGVNTILWTIPSTDEEALRQLDELHALGMKANVVMFWDMEPTGHPVNAERVIARMEAIKDHPAIYAWNVADEPYATANPPEGMTVRDLMIESYKVIRSVDKKYPVTYVEADYREYAQADDYADIIIIDPYPGTSSFASHVGDRTALITSAVERPVAVLHQSFSFAGCKPADYELHSMIYQGYLAGGAQMGHYGIGGAGQLEADEELWPVIQGIYESGEWDVLFKQYSSGVNETIESVRESNVWYDIFELDGVTYAALQNRTYGDVTVNLAGIAGFEAITWSEDVAVDAEIVNGALEVTLSEAQAVLLKLSTFVPADLVIVKQPEPAAAKIGDTVEFTVVAEGEGLTYEWFYKAVGSDQWQKSYSVGYNTDTLSVEMKAYRNGQEYKCVVSDTYGQTVESYAVAMTVAVSAFSITSQPVDFEGAENAMATFTVAAEGDGLTYRWQYSNDGGATWQNSWCDGYATDTLNVELKAYRDGQQYRCVVTDATCAQLISDAAALVLKVPTIEITAQPESATKAMYEKVTFTVDAEFGEETLKYRWYRSNDGGETWVETWLDGYDTNELSFVVNGPRAATPYKCKIYAKGITVWTDPVTVTIAD